MPSAEPWSIYVTEESLFFYAAAEPWSSYASAKPQFFCATAKFWSIYATTERRYYYATAESGLFMTQQNIGLVMPLSLFKPQQNLHKGLPKMHAAEAEFLDVIWRKVPEQKWFYAGL
jgi:hypothetical protein